MQRVVVVGAGVIGLSCAVRLAEAGYDVHVLARDLPGETTSSVAGGLWLPHLAGPVETVSRWAATTFVEMVRLHTELPAAGVAVGDGVLLHRSPSPPVPGWAAALEGLTTLTPVRDPRPGFAGGWALRVPVVDPGRYLPWLVSRLDAAGGTVTRMPLSALPQRGLVVDATGVSARALAHDPLVQPGRGQVVVVRNPGLTDWWTVEDEPGGARVSPYAIPRGDHVVVGGTCDVGSWDPVPDPELARQLLAAAVAVEPRLAGAAVLRHRVGLRPLRPAVRVEHERVGDADVVHCYGHGGSGYTLSWGCAENVLTLVRGLG